MFLFSCAFEFCWVLVKGNLSKAPSSCLRMECLRLTKRGGRKVQKETGREDFTITQAFSVHVMKPLCLFSAWQLFLHTRSCSDGNANHPSGDFQVSWQSLTSFPANVTTAFHSLIIKVRTSYWLSSLFALLTGEPKAYAPHWNSVKYLIAL